MFFGPFVDGANQSISQTKVVPEIQGRVFASRRMIAHLAAPLSMLIAGPLADRVFEPRLVSGGEWSGCFGWLVEVGPGAGMGMMIVLAGFGGIATGVVGYLVPAIRDAEARLPDFDD
jgi:DHA3 family macrolide efflux protein-like MFS transporter